MNLRVYVLALSTFAFGSGALIFAGLLEPMAADLGVPVGAVGQLQTAYVLTSALAGPPLAFFAGRFERRSLLLIALAVAVVLNLACYLIASFPALLVLRAVLGAKAYALRVCGHEKNRILVAVKAAHGEGRARAAGAGPPPPRARTGSSRTPAARAAGRDGS